MLQKVKDGRLSICGDSRLATLVNWVRGRERRDWDWHLLVEKERLDCQTRKRDGRPISRVNRPGSLCQRAQAQKS